MQPRDPDPEVDPRYRCCLHVQVVESTMDERYFGLTALAASVGFCVVLFIDAPVAARILMWLGWMAFYVVVLRLTGLPAWKDRPERKSTAVRLLVVGSILIVGVAMVVRITLG